MDNMFDKRFNLGELKDALKYIRLGRVVSYDANRGVINIEILDGFGYLEAPVGAPILGVDATTRSGWGIRSIPTPNSLIIFAYRSGSVPVVLGYLYPHGSEGTVDGNTKYSFVPFMETTDKGGSGLRKLTEGEIAVKSLAQAEVYLDSAGDCNVTLSKDKKFTFKIRKVTATDDMQNGETCAITLQIGDADNRLKLDIENGVSITIDKDKNVTVSNANDIKLKATGDFYVEGASITLGGGKYVVYSEAPVPIVDVSQLKVSNSVTIKG